jgi:predicted transcriptional regulator
VILGSVIPRAALPEGSAGRTGRLLRQEGCDLARATVEQLEAGCSVYLETQVEIATARALMGEHGIGQTPVLDGDELVGFAVLEALDHVAADGNGKPARAAAAPRQA